MGPLPLELRELSAKGRGWYPGCEFPANEVAPGVGVIGAVCAPYIALGSTAFTAKL